SDARGGGGDARADAGGRASPRRVPRLPRLRDGVSVGRRVRGAHRGGAAVRRGAPPRTATMDPPRARGRALVTASREGGGRAAAISRRPTRRARARAGRTARGRAGV